MPLSTTPSASQEREPVSDVLNDRMMTRQREIRPGTAEALEVKAGELVEIVDVSGKQVADFVTFALGDSSEWGSTSVTRSVNTNIMMTLGKEVYSNRRRPLLELVADTVGRHDMLYACCDPVRYEMLGKPDHASCRAALAEVLADYGVGIEQVPAPINWFMNVAIKQRGELEIRPPLSEANDHVVLKALHDVVVAVSACPQDIGPTNNEHPTDIKLRVYK
ncbi:MAG: urea carboxylase-associated family protein [Thermomicrobiales bacterium]|nr:urea carboxylase-associated family protein [Thermomicrobiales bacterium]